jgi:cell division topological specificity factor
MSVFNLFRRRGSAPVARERLQILLSHERAACSQSDLLGILREEILTVIAKHVTVERDNVQVRMDRGGTVSTLEINVEIQHSTAYDQKIETVERQAVRRGALQACRTQTPEIARLPRCPTLTASIPRA